MRKIVAKQVIRNITTRQIDSVWVSIFDRQGRETRSELMNGELFPVDLESGDEICFIQRKKLEQVENLARLGESLNG